MIERIKIPSNIKINFFNQDLTFQGKLGEFSLKIPYGLSVRYDDHNLYLFSTNKATVGTFVSLLKTKLKGVSQGFTVKLQLVGIGFRFIESPMVLKLKIGFSHKMVCKIPNNLTVKVIKPTLLSISGIDYESIQNFADQIRSLKTPESYKGKGIRYLDEKILLKEAKKK